MCCLRARKYNVPRAVLQLLGAGVHGYVGARQAQLRLANLKEVEEAVHIAAT